MRFLERNSRDRDFYWAAVAALFMWVGALGVLIWSGLVLAGNFAPGSAPDAETGTAP